MTDLTPAQRKAVDALAGGASHAAAATAAGVNRVTVTNWTNHNPAVRAELERLHSEARAGAVEAHRRLYTKALRWCEHELDTRGSEAARVALAVIAGSYRQPIADPAPPTAAPAPIVVRIVARRRDEPAPRPVV